MANFAILQNFTIVHWYGLTCISPHQIAPVSQNVTEFGNWVFEVAIKLKWYH
jgi:hypothetical protein